MSSTTESLTVVTRPTVAIDRLLDWATPQHSLAFVRDGDGVVGIGELLRLEFRGPDRFTEAAAAWNELSRTAVVHDSVKRSGTGLVALGSFAFDDSSRAVSVLVVPHVIVGSRDGIQWVTSISIGDTDPLHGTPDGLPPIPDPPIGKAAPTAFSPGQMSTQDFTGTVKAALSEIARGTAAKIVVARDQTAQLPDGCDLRIPLSALAARYPDTFTFAVDGLIGSSPETLVRVQNGTVSARVLAGSAARGDDRVSDGRAASALVSSPKDQEEHALALASVMDTLAPLSSELHAAAEPFALQLPNLWHLATDIDGQLSQQSSALDLIGVLHPTAAVAGTPTHDAIRLIAELENFDRGRYAGPVGWVDGSGNGEWAVALRCAQITGSQITAYAGAGIVAGSDADKELAETELKFRPIIEAFG